MIGRTRRFKNLLIAPDVFLGMLKEMREPTYLLTVTGLPDDAAVGNAGYDLMRDCFVITIWSEMFPEVDEGKYPPDLWLTITRHDRRFALTVDDPFASVDTQRDD